MQWVKWLVIFGKMVVQHLCNYPKCPQLWFSMGIILYPLRLPWEGNLRFKQWRITSIINKSFSNYRRTTWLQHKTWWNNMEISITVKDTMKWGLGISEVATIQIEVPQAIEDSSLAPNYYCSCKVLQRISNMAYKLESSHPLCVHLVFMSPGKYLSWDGSSKFVKTCKSSMRLRTMIIRTEISLNYESQAKI